MPRSADASGVAGVASVGRPEEQLFGRLRRNLTLMYAAVLAAMLVAMALALYVALRGQLLEPVAARAVGRSQFFAAAWGAGRQGPCSQTPGGGQGGQPPPRPPTEAEIWLVCFDP